MKSFRSILITGASSGLGEALALDYAAPGMTLALSGRNGDRLEQVAAACRAKGAVVDAQVVDVTDRDAMTRWIEQAEARAPLDLVIANAGVSGGTFGKNIGTDAQTRAIFAVNLDGVLNTVLPALEPMRQRRAGQIALMSSLAGLRGFPSAPAYCASKAAVRVWGEGLRGRLAQDGIGVTVICPGFVKSRITARNRFPMPFLMEADAAARLMRRAIAANRPRCSYPWILALVMALFASLPPILTDWLTRRLPTKE